MNLILKKTWQVVFYSLLISIVALIQASFINNLPGWLQDINLLLITLVFALFFYDFRTAIAVALIGGFWSEIFSFNFFGFYLVVLFFTLVFTHWILRTWLTNRSLYSFLVLIFLATLFYNLVAALMLYWFSDASASFFIWRWPFWSVLAGQVFWSELAGLFLFGLAASLTRRFKPFFLEKN